MKISGRAKEAIGVVAVLLGVVIMQGDLWITGKRMLSHDSIIWFGAFSYFVDCLHKGILPLWNPYMNCGEIFFLNIHVLHFWDPSTLFLVFMGKVFKISTLTIYHYDLLARYLIFISGGYFFFRRVAKYKFSAFVAFIALSFSALCSSYLKQHAFILPFYLLPWILLVTFKFFEERDSVSLIWLAFFWGIALCSYHAMYLIVSVAVLLMCLFFSKGLEFPKAGGIIKERKFAFAALLIFLLLSVNLLPVFLSYTRDTVPTARLFEAPLAAYSFPADFFNLFAPYSFMLHFERLYFRSLLMSESFLYIGLIPLFFAIIGLLYSRQKYRVGFIFTLGVTTLLMLGPGFFVSKFLSDFLPFFSIIRNTHTFGTFFIFCLAYFTCLGVDVVVGSAEKSVLSRYKTRFILIAVLISIAAIVINYFVLRNYAEPLKEFPDRYKELSLIWGRDFAVALKEIFLRSYYNIVLFIASIAVIFIIIVKRRSTLKFKYFVIIYLILIDLVIFNLEAYKFETDPRADMSSWPKGELAYSDHRIIGTWPRYPFFGFAPAMQRKFTAVSPTIPWVTTHFYEMKSFFYFANNDKIPIPVKSAFMGISAPKLRLVNGAAVLPPGLQAEEFKKLDGKVVNNALFIEEDPPAKFSGLEISGGDIGRANAVNGVIKVLEFGPNDLLLEAKPEEDSFLYYSDGFDKSWRAFVDGKEARVYRTNMAFKSVILEKGEHTVYFVYDPKLYKVTLFCYFAGILATIVTLIHVAFKRTQKAHGKSR